MLTYDAWNQGNARLDAISSENTEGPDGNKGVIAAAIATGFPEEEFDKIADEATLRAGVTLQRALTGAEPLDLMAMLVSAYIAGLLAGAQITAVTADA